MAVAHAVCELAPTSGLPEDTIVNTFTFSHPGVSALLEHTNIANGVKAFYNNTGTGPQPLAYYLGGHISRASLSRVKVYDVTNHLDGEPHGSPVYEDVFTLGAQAANAIQYPQEVALVLTLRAFDAYDVPVERPDAGDPGTAVDRPRQRSTGRVYLGPFNEFAFTGLSVPCRPSAAVRNAARDAAQEMADVLNPGSELVVWSRQDGVVRPVTYVETDDAFDTMRKRGVAPTQRNQSTLVP